jgi:penicillin-binding protein 2
VVNEYGTGGRARLIGLDVCGKTGTAQLASNQFLKGKSAKNLKDNAWFVGFAPRSAPEVMVAALFENGEHGQFAAPIVRDVIKAYFDKKARLQKTYRASTPPTTVPAALLTRPAEPPTAADPKTGEIVELRD